MFDRQFLGQVRLGQFPVGAGGSFGVGPAGGSFGAGAGFGPSGPFGGGGAGFGAGPVGGSAGFGFGTPGASGPGGAPGGPGGPGGPGSPASAASLAAAAAAALANGGDNINHCWLCADGIRMMTGAQMLASGLNCTMLDLMDPRCRVPAPSLTYSMGGKYRVGSRVRYGLGTVYVY